jgi:polyisoprenoid-binding protein YceI
MSTTKWVIDPTHSEIGFKVKHGTTISGKFSKFDATIEAEDSNLENEN